MSQYFYERLRGAFSDSRLIPQIKALAEKRKVQIFVVPSSLLLENKNISDCGYVVLSPDKKILIVQKTNDEDDFAEYKEDTIDDISQLSGNHKYQDVIGRPRKWKTLIVDEKDGTSIPFSRIFDNEMRLDDYVQKRIANLLITLFTGSINDVSNQKLEQPRDFLEIVKTKVQMFDTNQTRFIFDTKEDNKKTISIQGLSGTGKTELLLHKLREVFVSSENVRIFFTCYNKVLADTLKERIPSFFNFMKVNKQIEWNSNLWCTNAWGQSISRDTGAYRYICAFYGIQFYTYREVASFSDACNRAYRSIAKLKENAGDWQFAFTYMFIDESQDFDESFFDLCELVTEKQVYMAGDIFQDIFQEQHIDKVSKPDYSLSKCYRTDPKTLMFAHAMGMGLFESHKLRWLSDEQLAMCGYNCHRENGIITLTREPVRRFSDIEEKKNSFEIHTIPSAKISSSIAKAIKKLKEEYVSLIPGDIGIILIDKDKYIYTLADRLKMDIEEDLGWSTNIMYETKEKRNDSVNISNRNNVKGLEFPFVFCITKKIIGSTDYRNTLYTMFSRSLLRSYLILFDGDNGLSPEIKEGAIMIQKENKMDIKEPTVIEKKMLQSKLEVPSQSKTLYERIADIMNDMDLNEKQVDLLTSMIREMPPKIRDDEKIKKWIQVTLDLYGS